MHSFTELLCVRTTGIIFFEVSGSAHVAIICVGDKLKASDRDLGDALPPVQRQVEVVITTRAVELDAVFVREVFMGGVGNTHILRTMGNVGEAFQIVIGQFERGQALHTMITDIRLFLAKLGVQRFVPRTTKSFIQVKFFEVAFQTIFGQRVELNTPIDFAQFRAKIIFEIIAHLASRARVRPTVRLAMGDRADGEGLACLFRTQEKPGHALRALVKRLMVQTVGNGALNTLVRGPALIVGRARSHHVVGDQTLKETSIKPEVRYPIFNFKIPP